MKYSHFPKKQGLYDPQFEHDSCGVGFVCNIKGQKSNAIIKQGIEVLHRLSHRGAVGADPKTGDGAGILIQTPHEFFKKVAGDSGINLPNQGLYGTGLIFLPQDSKEREFCKEVFDKVIQEHGQILLGWRSVAIDDSDIGKGAKATQPVFEQVFIGRNKDSNDELGFERKLYIIRKQIENIIRAVNLKQKNYFYITNISSRTFSYKGLLMPEQLENFFLDLQDESIKSALCMVHSRYSTNTFPTWDLAQPFRFLAHNGEINTLRGNINGVRARERLLASELFGTDIEKLKPVIVEGGSDSAAIDNVFELLVLSGRSLEHTMMMLIPAAWEHNKFMSKELRDFYKYHACFMEPWDGPAAIAFTDGKNIGAVLDRNGLRPARYIVTNSDFVVMASEVGVLDIDPADIKISGRLEPGKIFFIDTESGCIVEDSEIKKRVSSRCPYGKWNAENMVDFDRLVTSGVSNQKSDDIISHFKVFGYSREDLKVIIKPMAQDGKEPVGSMGNDTPHAFLSKSPQLLYNYFKQLFAQVTNPAIDSIREKLVMSLESFIGPEKNILEETPKHSHKLRVKNPILADEELQNLRDISINGFKTKTIYTFFDAASGKEGFLRALERICFEAEYAIEKGFSFIILSDRGVDKDNIALPALLATSAIHQYLVKKTIRSQVALIVESAEPREVHHLALLFGYGADCINPYLAYEAIEYLVEEKEISLNYKKAKENYNKALTDGILKILSKMGISTLASYRGAQIFEALGLDEEFIDRYFTGTVSRIGGVGLEGIVDETIKRHREAYSQRDIDKPYLASGGIYQWKKDGEFHLWNPESIAALQDAARDNDYDRYRKFSQMINDQSANPTTLRSLLEFKKREPISIDEVESVENIMKRFVTGAMSFGSISGVAHETIAIAMNRIGGKSNTGEGGEDPNRFVILPNGDSRRSAIKQVASGRFGVTINYLVNSDEIQIKIAQGAKPGEGGQLPGHKVSEIIARTRYTTPGVTLISPPPHHDIYSIEDLAQLIFDLKNANPHARISVKLVSEVGVGTVAAGVAKGHADMILISGGDGGTGASPRSSIRYAGLPWELGLSETHQTLLLNNLRSRVRLQTDGQMRTGRDVAIAALLGAEEYGFCTAVLIVIGCVMLRHCHLNNCSVGVATQEDILQKRFRGRPEFIVNYFHFVAEELRQIMAGLGLKTIDEMIGRVDFLEVNRDIIPLKAKGLDYSRILYKPDVSQDVGRYCQAKQESGLDYVLDKELIKMCEDSFEKNKPAKISMEINNTNRTTGAMLSGEVCRRCGDGVLLEDTIVCKFKGTAGQSFGAFLAKGITFELEGMTNDYVGKGISGGKIIIYPDRKAHYKPEENIIIGNTTFYGAISGEAYICGVAGERFCIRNSGLHAVVEGVGDHGCEYMTGGRVLVLGKTGRNFAAGMSGGIAYVYDEDKTFKENCNTDMVELGQVKEEDKDTIYNLLHNHFKYTKSKKAKRIIDNMDDELKKFVRVIPIEYKRILEGVKIEEELDLAEASDG
ncbi:MAG: glutamate synthase large subunit [Candidatus Omnitrophica bacterium]|nr:glutamate synthase large subunit [Candidatus Omnitrophota bacterium]MDD5549664.1 glutamate synthase large subunit [Candidatus Omnitrophota bacterium]